MVLQTPFDALNGRKDDNCDIPPPATPPPSASPQTRAALWNPLEGDTSAANTFYPESPLGFIDLNRMMKTYFKFAEDEEENKRGEDQEDESHPSLTCNPLSPSAVPPTARTIYSVRRPDRSSPTTSPSRQTVQQSRATPSPLPLSHCRVAPSSPRSPNGTHTPTLSGSSLTNLSGTSEFATILRTYVGSDASDESSSDESDLNGSDEDTIAQRVNKGKGRAIEPAPGWEVNFEAGDFLDDNRDLCVDPREAFAVEEEDYADAEEDTFDDGDDDQDDDHEYVENDDAEASPTGPSTSAAYYGAGPITSAPVALGTLQRLNTQSYMNEGSSALGSEQPTVLPSKIGVKRKRDADDEGSDGETKVVVGLGTPLHQRMSNAEIQEAYDGSKHPNPRKTLDDFGCRVWPEQPAKWCCHFCPYALQERSSIKRHVKAHHYAGTLSCEPYGCLCGDTFVTSRRELLERHLSTDWRNSKRRKTGEPKPKNVKRGMEGKKGKK